jgi:hypothetical protein
MLLDPAEAEMFPSACGLLGNPVDELRDFWEICEDCDQVRSTILTSRLAA